jgi:hypothetical protein
VPELALDDVQRHALASELERVRVTLLVRREATPDAGERGGTRCAPRHPTTVARGWVRR